MGMTSIQVELSDELYDYVMMRVAGGEYATPSDFLGALIRQDMERNLAGVGDDRYTSESSRWPKEFEFAGGDGRAAPLRTTAFRRQYSGT